jgi:hypothetical protein
MKKQILIYLQNKEKVLLERNNDTWDGIRGEVLMCEEAKIAARRILKHKVKGRCKLIQKGVIIFQDEKLGDGYFTYMYLANVKRENVKYSKETFKWFSLEEMSEIEPKMKNRLLAFLLNEKRLFAVVCKSKDGKFEDFKIRYF